MPIVEPEVLMDGDHDIARCYDVTEFVLKETFQELYYQRVALEGMVLKPNMIVAGKKSTKKAGVAELMVPGDIVKEDDTPENKPVLFINKYTGQELCFIVPKGGI